MCAVKLLTRKSLLATVGHLHPSRHLAHPSRRNRDARPVEGHRHRDCWAGVALCRPRVEHRRSRDVVARVSASANRGDRICSAVSPRISERADRPFFQPSGADRNRMDRMDAGCGQRRNDRTECGGVARQASIRSVPRSLQRSINSVVPRGVHLFVRMSGVRLSRSALLGPSPGRLGGLDRVAAVESDRGRPASPAVRNAYFGRPAHQPRLRLRLGQAARREYSLISPCTRVQRTTRPPVVNGTTVCARGGRSSRLRWGRNPL